MDINTLLKEAKQAGKTALNESESKQLLKAFGIPVVSETVVFNKDDALSASREIGFPVVLKGLGSTFLHKTEQGMVHLNITDSKAAAEAVASIARVAGDQLEGFLVQPYIKGNREFAAGIFKDQQFGPVIMFGIGGTFTEALADVTFRLAPITETDAAEMLNEIRAKALLANFRGQSAADRKLLIRTLMGLSRIAVEHPEIGRASCRERV